MQNTKDDKKVYRIMIVDDHPIVRKGIRAILEQESDLAVCAEAESSGEALQQLQADRPDAAVIDIGLKGSDGLELLKSIRYQDESLPILVMSMHDESLYAERVLRAGGNGYIMKEAVDERIVTAIREVIAGRVYVSDAIRQRILQGMTGRDYESGSSPVERLSDRELEVFSLIGKGKGTREIAEQLHLSVKTIETYRAHIKEKMGITTAPELVRVAVQWVEGENAP